MYIIIDNHQRKYFARAKAGPFGQSLDFPGVLCEEGTKVFTNFT